MASVICARHIPPPHFFVAQLTLLFAQPSFVVGREFSGKSTLCKNLCEVQQQKGAFWRRFRLHSVSIETAMRTHGVEVFRTRRGYWGHPELQMVFLDFGGHTVYGAGQEFFMAEGNAMAVVLLSPLEQHYRDGFFLSSFVLVLLFLPNLSPLLPLLQTAHCRSWHDPQADRGRVNACGGS